MEHRIVRRAIGGKLEEVLGVGAGRSGRSAQVEEAEAAGEGKGSKGGRRVRAEHFNVGVHVLSGPLQLAPRAKAAREEARPTPSEQK
jgi:hypothetical protein